MAQRSFWYESAAFQRSAFGRATAGNDVVATIFTILFLSPPFFPFFFSSVVTFSHRRSTRIKKLISESCLERLGVDTFPDPVGPFWAPWCPFWILKAVRNCRW